MRGLPVVAANLEGLAEAVVDRMTGILLPSSDAGAWIAELTRLAADCDRLSLQGQAFQKAACERYSERVMGDELLRVLGLEPAGAESEPAGPTVLS